MLNREALPTIPIKVFTIGFTKTTARSFFETLRQAGVVRIIDVRLHNQSQLAGFAKRDDLKYFLQGIARIGYHHDLNLAPTPDILDEYKKRKGTWADYEAKFVRLIQERQIHSAYGPSELSNACLLCSEHKPHHCHRRLVAEYFQRQWGEMQIEHLIPKGEVARDEDRRHRSDEV